MSFGQLLPLILIGSNVIAVLFSYFSKTTLSTRLISKRSNKVLDGQAQKSTKASPSQNTDGHELQSINGTNVSRASDVREDLSRRSAEDVIRNRENETA